MKRVLCLIIFLLYTVGAGAEVSILSVADEDVHSKKEDFLHTFEYFITAPNGKTSKCQATRIARSWFATAAHCVVVPCQNSCTLVMDILEQPVSALLKARHSKQKPVVFVHSKYAGQTSDVKHDFALLKMDLAVLPAQYYRRGEKENTFISRAEFESFIAAHPNARRELNAVMRPKLLPVLVFDGGTRRIKSTISVISIFDGKRSILQNPYPTDYVQELGYACTQNFGVRKGMSGSGVMTNTGELAGIISANVAIRAPTEKTREYFLFTVFNPSLTEFMESVMGSDYYKLDRRSAYPGYVAKTANTHQDLIEAVHSISKKSR